MSLFDMSLWGRIGRRAGQPLRALVLSASTIAENSSAGTAVGALLGKMPGSTVAIVSQSQSGWFALNGTTLEAAGAIDYETDPAPTVTIRETIPGQAPRDTVLTITVTDVAEAFYRIPAGDMQGGTDRRILAGDMQSGTDHRVMAGDMA